MDSMVSVLRSIQSTAFASQVHVVLLAQHGPEPQEPKAPLHRFFGTPKPQWFRTRWRLREDQASPELDPQVIRAGASALLVVTRTLLGTSATLLGTSALLVVTMFATRNKCIATRNTAPEISTRSLGRWVTVDWSKTSVPEPARGSERPADGLPVYPYTNFL